MGNFSLFTIIIIAANVIISYKGFEDYRFFERYKFNIGGIRRGEQFRVFSSGFLHADSTHLLFNMITLYFFAGRVNYELGQFNFLIVYFGSLVLGSLLSFYFHKNEYQYSAVGASGAVMGVIYSAILIDPMMQIYAIIPGFVFGVAYLLYSIYGMKKRIGNIGHDAHFGGAVGGYLITLFMKPSLFQEQPLMVGILAIPIVVLFIMHKLGKI